MPRKDDDEKGLARDINKILEDYINSLCQIKRELAQLEKTSEVGRKATLKGIKSKLVAIKEVLSSIKSDLGITNGPPLLPEEKEQIYKSYAELREYDLHYSNVRSGVAIFLLGLGFGADALFIQSFLDPAKGWPGDETVLSMFLFPFIIFSLALYFSANFQRLTYICESLQLKLDEFLSGKPGFCAEDLGVRTGIYKYLQGKDGETKLKLLVWPWQLRWRSLRWIGLGKKKNPDEPGQKAIIVILLLHLIGTLWFWTPKYFTYTQRMAADLCGQLNDTIEKLPKKLCYVVDETYWVIHFDEDATNPYSSDYGISDSFRPVKYLAKKLMGIGGYTPPEIEKFEEMERLFGNTVESGINRKIALLPDGKLKAWAKNVFNSLSDNDSNALMHQLDQNPFLNQEELGNSVRSSWMNVVDARNKCKPDQEGKIICDNNSLQFLKEKWRKFLQVVVEKESVKKEHFGKAPIQAETPEVSEEP